MRSPHQHTKLEKMVMMAEQIRLVAIQVQQSPAEGVWDCLAR